MAVLLLEPNKNSPSIIIILEPCWLNLETWPSRDEAFHTTNPVCNCSFEIMTNDNTYIQDDLIWAFLVLCFHVGSGPQLLFQGNYLHQFSVSICEIVSYCKTHNLALILSDSHWVDHLEEEDANKTFVFITPPLISWHSQCKNDKLIKWCFFKSSLFHFLMKGRILRSHRAETKVRHDRDTLSQHFIYNKF